ncbi:MAG TPA: FG-GAP-like repeat-containing protein, partial [Flavitalea sp.]|nr:FG-GAP-like repeat-containing protein [Flavitalea sp.]
NNASSGSISGSSFNTRVDFALSSAPKSIATADINGDGKPEILSASSDGIGILPNTATSGSISSGSFGTVVYLATGNTFRSLVAADIDGDQRPDIIAGGDATGLLSILQNIHSSGNISSASFSTKVDLSIGSNNPSDIAVGDLDADGKPDIIVPNTAENNVSVFKNTGTQSVITTGSFAAPMKFNTVTTPVSVVISDITGDGKPDLAISNSISNSISILTNATVAGVIDAGSFNVRVNFATGLLPGSLSAGDLDGDGKPDLTATNTNGTSLSVLRNTTTHLLLPLTLLSFSGRIAGTDALLNWTTDHETNTIAFDVERSLNGSHFSLEGTVSSNNITGIQQYTFTDAGITTINAPALYYRLKQRDIDGRFTYSPVIKLSLANKTSMVQLYPNVVINQATLYFTLNKNEKVQVTITDNSGRIVKRFSHKLEAGSSSLPVDVSSLAPGIYNLEVHHQGKQETKRFIKE